MNNQQIEVQSLEYALNQLPWDNTVVIMSPTSANKLDDECQRLVMKKLGRCLYTAELTYSTVLDEVSKLSSRVPLTTIVGLGGGTAIDYAKYVAKALDLYCIAVPSMLSTNVFATNKVAVLDNGAKHTEDGRLPDTIWLDWGYLSKSPQENLYGLVDVFSIYQALRDWKCAQRHNNEVIDQNIWNRAVNLLHMAVQISGDPDTHRIFEVVREAGYITNDYGSGRPESGSEHIFASALESKITIPHALSVTLGIHIMEFLSRYVLEDTASVCSLDQLPFRSLKINDAIGQMHLRYDDIYELTCNLKPRADKYTMVNLLSNVPLVSGLYLEMKKYLVDYSGIQLEW